VRRVLARQLRRLGYVVMEAETGVEALALLSTHAIDLLLSDVIMPGEINGLQLAHIANTKWPDLKVIRLSQ
jgi:CheY-like chemotaxis protein